MVRIAICVECGLSCPCWGEPDGYCIAHLDAADGARNERKLTPALVVALRRDRAAGASYSALGRRYGLTHCNARLCALGLSYREVAAA